MDNVDLLSALLDRVREAARQGTAEALAAAEPPPPQVPLPLVDKRGIAASLGLSPATIDRLCRDGRIPYTLVGDVRRFDIDSVRAALKSIPATSTSETGSRMRPSVPGVSGVRLLSGKRQHASTTSPGRR